MALVTKLIATRTRETWQTSLSHAKANKTVCRFKSQDRVALKCCLRKKHNGGLCLNTMGVHGGLCFLQIQALVVTSSDLSDCYRYPRSGIPLGCWRVYSLAFLTYSLASLHFMPRLLLNFQFFRKTSGWLLGSLVLHSSFESALRYLSLL